MARDAIGAFMMAGAPLDGRSADRAARDGRLGPAATGPIARHGPARPHGAPRLAAAEPLTGELTDDRDPRHLQRLRRHPGRRGRRPRRPLVRRDRPAARRGRGPRRLVERQLQGRPGDDPERQGRPDRSADPRHRPGRRGGRERRPVDRDRLGRPSPRLRAGRLPSRRLRRVRPRAGRLGRSASGRAHAAPCDGDRDGRLHGGDVGGRAGGARAAPGCRAGARDGRIGWRRLDGGRDPRGPRPRGLGRHAASPTRRTGCGRSAQPG